MAQAVSWAKALQTHFWHPGEAVKPGSQDPHYDHELIDQLVAAIERFEADWSRWFTGHRVSPYEVAYEELAADPLLTAHNVLDFLSLDVPPDQHLVIGHHRQADHLNADWVARIKAHRAGSST